MKITAYRKQIRDAWLKVVGRRALKSAEYDFIKELFAAQTPVEVVLKAIQMCTGRARRAHKTIYSLGVIRADIRTIMAQKANSKVGALVQEDGWRERWANDLRETIEDYPKLREPLEKLIADLPCIDRGEAESRWAVIVREIVED